MRGTYRLDPALSKRARGRLDRGFAAAGWTSTDEREASLHWLQGAPDPVSFFALGEGQRFNHFPGFAEFGHKGRFHRNVTAARLRAGEPADYAFHPTSFDIPDQYDEWRAEADRSPGDLWIVKPPRGGQGQGIRVVADPDRVPSDEELVVQRYVDRPHLIDGRKYVLRVWVLVASLDPLVCFMHSNGVFKMTSSPFATDASSVGDLTVHLTNPSVQAQHPDVPLGSLNSDLTTYRRMIRRDGVDDGALFERIRQVVARAVIACREPALRASRHIGARLDGCFELLGPDILVDEDLTPWVLEMNTFPSLEVSRDADPGASGIVRAAKDEMVRDVAAIVTREEPCSPVAADGFTVLWPGRDADRFLPDLALLRPRERVLASRVCERVPPTGPVPLARPDIAVQAAGEGIELHDLDKDRRYLLDPIGAAVWLCLADGLAPDAIIAELRAAFPEEPTRRIEDDVWDLLSNWAQHGLLTQLDDKGSGPRIRTQPEQEEPYGIGANPCARSA